MPKNPLFGLLIASKYVDKILKIKNQKYIYEA